MPQLLLHFPFTALALREGECLESERLEPMATKLAYFWIFPDLRSWANPSLPEPEQEFPHLQSGPIYMLGRGGGPGTKHT